MKSETFAMTTFDDVIVESKLGCPSCASTRSREWGARERRKIFECDACGLLYFARPIHQSYDYQEFYPYLKEFDDARFDRELGIRRRKFHRQLADIRRLAPRGSTLVDIGAGPGYFCRIATEQGWNASGIEPSSEARHAGAERFGVRYIDFDAIADASIDVVTCHHVLEHIEWPQEFLALIRKKLRSGGLLILHVPNQQPLSFQLYQIFAGSSNDARCSLYYPIHITGFKTKSLVAMVERQSFEAMKVFNVSMWSNYYDPFFLADYFGDGKSTIGGLARASKHAFRCAVDVIGNYFDRGDWLVGCFRAVDEPTFRA
jgi:2-polyprenyl-3-methyl-5-hydroxy-6-metoxy-1,4-benzoquinol methylase